MKVKDVFKNQKYSKFTQAAVEAGELLEKQGWVLESEYYSQGTQVFHFRKKEFLVDILIKENDE